MSKATEHPTTAAAAQAGKLILPAITGPEAAEIAINDLAEAVNACARTLPGKSGLPLARAAGDLLQVATALRQRQDGAEAEDGAETVTSCYAAWLLERGAAIDGEEKSGDRDAWAFAMKSFSLPAREAYEIAYKVEMADWIFASGDPGSRTRRAVFAGIAADLEG